MIKLTIIDYKMGNVTSIVNMLNNFANIKIELSNDPKTIIESDKLILPGVGAFGNAMQNIDKFNLIEPINAYVNKGNSLLGICLGMQLLMDSSEEFGKHKGLGLISGSVRKISKDKDVRLPNVGFYKLNKLKEKNKKKNENYWFYFIQSYKCIPKYTSNISSIINYENRKIVAGLKKDNILGCQFHPEKSHQAGIDYYKEFING